MRGTIGRLKARNMASGHGGVVMHVTAPNDDIATSISVSLVEKHLAACVQKIAGLSSALP